MNDTYVSTLCNYLDETESKVTTKEKQTILLDCVKKINMKNVLLSN